MNGPVEQRVNNRCYRSQKKKKNNTKINCPVCMVLIFSNSSHTSNEKFDLLRTISAQNTSFS